MKTKRTIAIRHGDGFIDVEIDALDFSDVAASVDLCLDGPANFRAMELARKIADDRARAQPCAVYVVAPDDLPVCKIGIARSPHTRLIEIQNGCWHELSVKALLWADRESYEIEQLALKAAKELGLYLRGEWVAAEPRQACELVIKAARYGRKTACDSSTWMQNWSARLDAVASAMGRGEAIRRLRPRGGKFGA